MLRVRVDDVRVGRPAPVTMAAATSPAAVHDDVPLLVRVLAGNPVTSACILSCLTTTDTGPLRRLHVAVAGAVAGVPWAYTETVIVDVVRWWAALPAAVGATLSQSAPFSVARMAALTGLTFLDLSDCRNVTDWILGCLPNSLRTLRVALCTDLTERANFAHFKALISLDYHQTDVVTDSLPPSLQDLKVGRRLAGKSLAHLSQLRVLRAGGTDLDDTTLASLPPRIVELEVRTYSRLTAAASFAHLPVLQMLSAANSSLSDAALATLPPSLVSLDVNGCSGLTPAAVLPPLPALRLLDMSNTNVGDALVASLPVALHELCMVQCRGVTTAATLDHLPALRALHSMGTALEPAVVDACRARGCAVPAAGVLRGHRGNVIALAVLADGRLTSVDSGNFGNVLVWDVAAGGDATAVLRVGDVVSVLAVLPDGRHLVLGTGTRTLQVWDVAATPPVRVASIRGNTMVLALATLADGRLATGYDDGSVWVEDVDAGVATELGGHSRRVIAMAAPMAVLPDGTLASGSYADGTVRLWDLGRHVCVAVLAGHTGGVQSLAVLADGRLAAGASNGMISLWDVRSHTRVGALAGHRDHMATLAALPDGRLVSGAREGVFQLWDTRPAAAAAVAATSRAASTVPMTVLARVPSRGVTTALALLPDGRLACTCSNEVLLLEVPPPATYE